MTKPKRYFGRWPRSLLHVATVLVAPWVLGACDDNRFQLDWEISPDTVQLFSLAVPELNLPSALNFAQPVPGPLIVESTSVVGDWDVVFDTEAGQIVVLAPGAFGLQTRARITERTNTDFFALEEAPRDTAVYTATGPLVLNPTSVYVVRSHEEPGIFGSRCVYYAKFTPLQLDPVTGELEVVYDESPVCNDRRLVPPN